MNRKWLCVALTVLFLLTQSVQIPSEGVLTARTIGSALAEEAETAGSEQTPAEETKEKQQEEPAEEPDAPQVKDDDKPTEEPTEKPTEAPTEEPTEAPAEKPTEAPTEEPTEAPTEEPTEAPTEEPTEAPTEEPTEAPTEELPSETVVPTAESTLEPTLSPALEPELTSEILLEAKDTDAGFLYEVSNGEATITGYKGTENALKVPATLGGYPVVEIGVRAFYNKHITSVELPDSVKTIANGGFTDCLDLRSVSMGNGLTSIGEQAFLQAGIRSITIPDSVKTIGKQAFASCDALKSVVIASGIETIGDYAFYDSWGLSSVTLPDKFIAFGNYVFQECPNLTGTAFLPSSMSTIPRGMFQRAGITVVTWPSSVSSIGQSAFEGCTKLSAIHVPATVTDIGSCAFSGCEGLTEASLPTGLTSVGESIFSGCKKLGVLVLPDDMTQIPDHMFSGTAIETIALPDRVTKLGNYAFSDCALLTDVNLNKVSVMMDGVFSNCPKLESIEIPKAVTRIKPYAFANCKQLSSFTFHEETMEELGDYAFSGCKSLTSFVFPTLVTKVSEGLFKGSGLQSITMHDGVTVIGARAFANTASLSSFVFPNSLESIGTYAFYYSGLLNAYISEKTHQIEDYAFEGCSQLEEVILPDSLGILGQGGVFKKCVRLKTVHLGVNMKIMRSDSFNGCIALNEINLDNIELIELRAFQSTGFEELTIPDSVKFICYSAFWGCEHLTDLVVDGAPIIDEGAFCNCVNLIRVDLGSIPSIPSSAFVNCSSLLSVMVPSTVKSIGSAAFANCELLMNATIPKTVTEIGEGAFDNCDNLVIYCTTNSAAHVYAYYNGIPFVLTDSSSDFKFIVYKKQIILLAYTGKAETVNVPSKIGKYPVTVIAENAFYGNSKVKQINVPSTVKEIEYAAFMRCTALTGISLPAGLNELGPLSFALCPKLEHIVLPAGLTTLHGSTFAGCYGLNSVTLPDRLKKIGAYDFTNCLKLGELIIPESVIEIDDNAFAGTDLTLAVGEGSVAEGYAKAQGISFRLLSKVKVSVAAQDGSVTGAGEYLEGMTVTLQAKANKNYEFLYWLVDENQIKGTTYTFVASQNRTIEAVFDWAGKTVVKVDKTSVKLEPGETCTLMPSILPRKRASQNIVWKSSNESIARVQNGVVTAVKNGTVTITAIATDGSKSSAKCTVTVRTLVDSIAVTGNQTLSYKQSASLKAMITPVTASNKGVSWTSSNKNVATISSDGKVTARKVAAATSVTITATAKDGSGATGSLQINVLPAATKVTVEAESGTPRVINLGEVDPMDRTLQLTAIVSPEDASKAIRWTSSKTRIAKVDAYGLVTGVAVGKATITATAKDGSGKKGTFTVNVTRLANAITITGEQTLAEGRSTTLTAKVAPSNTSNKAVSWTTSDSSIATVSKKGVVTAKAVTGPETVTITAETSDGSGLRDSLDITVVPSADSVTVQAGGVEAGTLRINLNAAVKTVQLTAVVRPDDAIQGVNWTSSNNKVAKVGSTGLLAGVGPGSATITATAADGSRVFDKCLIRAAYRALSVNITGATEIVEGKSATLTAKVLPKNSTNKALTWAVDNQYAATVSDKGVVTAKDVDLETAVLVTARLKDEPEIFCMHEITVLPKPDAVVIQYGEEPAGESMTVNMNNSNLKLSAKVSPSDARQVVSWMSSDTKIATVDQNGAVAIKKTGQATITATAVGTAVKDTLHLTIEEAAVPSSIHVDPDEYSGEVNTDITIPLENISLTGGSLRPEDLAYSLREGSTPVGTGLTVRYAQQGRHLLTLVGNYGNAKRECPVYVVVTKDGNAFDLNLNIPESTIYAVGNCRTLFAEGDADSAAAVLGISEELAWTLEQTACDKDLVVGIVPDSEKGFANYLSLIEATGSGSATYRLTVSATVDYAASVEFTVTVVPKPDNLPTAISYLAPQGPILVKNALEIAWSNVTAVDGTLPEGTEFEVEAIGAYEDPAVTPEDDGAVITFPAVGQYDVTIIARAKNIKWEYTFQVEVT